MNTSLPVEYIDMINKSPVLSREEQFNLLTIVKGNDCAEKEKAREKLIISNMRMVIKQASYYSKVSNAPIEDLIGAGSEGLCIAISRFDLSYKNKIITYATSWIKRCIMDFMRKFNSEVYVPRELLRKYRKCYNMANNQICDEEIMSVMNVNEDELRKIRRVQSRCFSMDKELFNEEPCCSVIRDLMPDNKAEQPFEKINNKEKRSVLHKEIARLDHISAYVLVSRYLSAEKQTLYEISRKMNVSAERVRQIEQRALKKIRRRLKSREIAGVIC